LIMDLFSFFMGVGSTVALWMIIELIFSSSRGSVSRDALYKRGIALIMSEEYKSGRDTDNG